MNRHAPKNPVIIIPARMASTRLPNKPLADINGLPMIVQVWKRAIEADFAAVLVACAEPEIADAVRDAGGQAVLTDPNHPSGSDRIFEALQLFDSNATYDAILNVQGDLPTISPADIRAAFDVLKNPVVDIATLAAVITDSHEKDNPNVVKAVIEPENAEIATGTIGRALYFTRATAPTGAGALLHHIGLYGYRRDALTRFVASKPAWLETRERLEQLRALALGMRIDVAIVDSVPLGVDTPKDLLKARKYLSEFPA